MEKELRWYREQFTELYSFVLWLCLIPPHLTKRYGWLHWIPASGIKSHSYIYFFKRKLPQGTLCQSPPCSPPSTYAEQDTTYIFDLLGPPYIFGLLGPTVLPVSPHNSLCTPSFLTGGMGWEAEKSLMLCKPYSEVMKTSLSYQHCFPHKLWRKFTLSQPKLMQSWCNRTTLLWYQAYNWLPTAYIRTHSCSFCTYAIP